MAGNHNSNRVAKAQSGTLSSLAVGEQAVLDRIDLPFGDAQRLMELGFLPGAAISAARGSPLGHTLVFRVDGSEVALRRETAARLILRTDSSLETA